MSFGEECIQKIAAAREPLLGVSRRLAAHRLFPLAAPELLVNQYHLIRATPRLLSHGIRACEERPGQAFASKLGDYFAAKLWDERGHDVLLLQDLERLRVDRGRAELGPVDPDIQAMVGAQFYLCDFQHPAAFLGYIAILEAFVPSPEQVTEFGKAAGIPENALSCMSLHARADVGHAEDLGAILDQVPGPYRAMVLTNAAQCAEWQRQAVLTLCRRLDALRAQVKPEPAEAA